VHIDEIRLSLRWVYFMRENPFRIIFLNIIFYSNLASAICLSGPWSRRIDWLVKGHSLTKSGDGRVSPVAGTGRTCPERQETRVRFELIKVCWR